MSTRQAFTLADQVHGTPNKDTELDLFLAKSNTIGADIRGAVIHLEGTALHATMLLSQHGKDYEVECPIGIAPALAVRANAPILVDEALFDKAGARPSATPCEPQ